MKKYAFILCLLTALFSGCRDEKFDVTIISDALINPSASKAEIYVFLSCKDNREYSYAHADVQDIGFFYSTTNQNPSEKDAMLSVKAQSVTADYSRIKYYGTVSGLAANTTYYARPFVYNRYGFLTYDDVITFTTNGGATVTTQEASNIAAYSAQLNGSIQKVGNNVNLQKRGFVWSTNTNPTLESYKGKWENTQNVEGAFSTTASSLSAKTTYYFRAFAMVDNEVLYGDVKSFTTLDNTVSLTLNDASNIYSLGVTFTGSVMVGQGAAGTVTEVGFMYGKSSTPITANSSFKTCYYITNTAWYGTKDLSLSLTNLTPSTTYYYRMFYLSGGSYYYSEIKSFKTPSEDGSEDGGTVTVAQFKSKPDDINTWYTVTGVIYRIENSTYGNLYLVDNTGLLAVYGVTATKQVSHQNDKSFASLGLQAGDYVTISGPKKTYGTSDVEMYQAYLVKKNDPLTKSNTFTTFALEPTTKTAFSFNEATQVSGEAHIYVGGYEGGDYMGITLEMANDANQKITMSFYSTSLDDDIVMPVGTFPCQDRYIPWYCRPALGYEAMYNSVSGSMFYYQPASFTAFAPYFLTSGSVTVTKVNNKANIQFNFTSYYGSTVTGNVTVDTKANMTVTSSK